MKRDTKLTGAPNSGDGLNASHFSKMSIRLDMSLRGKRWQSHPLSSHSRGLLSSLRSSR
jgi:hypothetical protein